MKLWNKICGLILFLLFTYCHLPAQNTFSLQLNNSTFLLKEKLKIPDTTVHSLYTSSVVSVCKMQSH
jgi:hypothetical protein